MATNKRNNYRLEDIPSDLEKLVIKDKLISGYCIKYNGQRLRMSSGKKLWTSVGAAKNAIINEFSDKRHTYSLPFTGIFTDEHGRDHALFDYENMDPRAKEFRERLLSLVEIIPLTESAG